MLKIQTIARLGQDATSNNVNGKNVINFSVAHSEKFKNQQGSEVDKTTWISCAYWTERLNLLPFLKKGTLVYLEGKPEAKTYVNTSNATLPQLHARISILQLLSSGTNKSETEETPF